VRKGRLHRGAHDGVRRRLHHRGLASGSYSVTVRSRVAGAGRQGVVVRANGETSVDFVMQAVELEAVTVTAMLREQKLATSVLHRRTTEQALRCVRRQHRDDRRKRAGFSVQNLGPGQSQVAMRGASSGQIARDQPGEDSGRLSRRIPVSLSLFTPTRSVRREPRGGPARAPGTLFGAGSEAGTVRYISNQPELA